MFKSARQKRFIMIIFWIIIIFIAIIKLPNVTSLITNLNERVTEPSQIAQSEQLINANRLKHGWGRQLGRTSTVDIVYNRRNGQITNRQQKRIDRRIDYLQDHPTEFGIKKVTDLNTDRNGTDELKSKDNSTEMVKLNVNRRYLGTSANLLADEIKSKVKVPDLRTSITSPQILRADGTRNAVHLTVIVTIVSLLLASLALGLIFKSLIAPIISLTTLLIADLTSLSLTSNLAQWTGFNEFTPLAILTIVTVAGTIMAYFIDQAIINELPQHRDPNNAVRTGLDQIKRPVELSGLILTLAFGAAIVIPEAPVRSLANFGITFAVLTMAELTIGPIFISWLGKGFLWPSHRYERPAGHKLWNRLTRLSLWQPLIGIIAVAYFTVPFIYSYRPNLSYAQTGYLSNQNQAYRGASELNAHFTAGKATPVTIYLKDPQKFNHERTLEPVDELTTKLQSMPGVNAVYSLTQPSGMPINKYYVNHQLNTVDNSLNQDQNQLYQTGQQLKRGRKKLGQKQLDRIQTKLNDLKRIHGQIPKTNLDAQLKRVSAGQKASVAAKLNNYQDQLQDLNGKLGQLSGSLDNAGNLSNNVKDYQKQIKAVNKKLASAMNQIKTVNGKLNTVYGYLSSLQRSSASHQYFITPDQIQDTDFQQSLINFTGQNERTTKLQVIFNQAPSTRYNRSRLKNLKSEVKTELQGTPLSAAKVAISGEPVQQATVQSHFRSGALKALAITFGIILLGLMLISQSIMNPLFWSASFIISVLTGFQLTHLIVRFTTNQAQFNWQITLSSLAVLCGVAVIELVPVSLAYRHRRVRVTEWLHEALTSFGQNVTAVLSITVLTAGSLFTGLTYQTAQFSLLIITSIIIFNWALPLLASAFGKYFQKANHNRT